MGTPILFLQIRRFGKAIVYVTYFHLIIGDDIFMYCSTILVDWSTELGIYSLYSCKTNFVHEETLPGKPIQIKLPL